MFARDDDHHVVNKASTLNDHKIGKGPVSVVPEATSSRLQPEMKKIEQTSFRELAEAGSTSIDCDDKSENVCLKLAIGYESTQGAGTFPLKLYDVLDAADRKGFNHIVSWHDDGNSFKIHNKENFVGDILPLYFNQIKYKSFHRQLNLYGFSRIHKGPTRGSYFHAHFARGNRLLALTISRQPAPPVIDRRRIIPTRPSSPRIRDLPSGPTEIGDTPIAKVDATRSRGHLQSNTVASERVRPSYDSFGRDSLVRSRDLLGKSLLEQKDGSLAFDKRRVTSAGKNPKKRHEITADRTPTTSDSTTMSSEAAPSVFFQDRNFQRVCFDGDARTGKELRDMIAHSGAQGGSVENLQSLVASSLPSASELSDVFRSDDQGGRTRHETAKKDQNEGHSFPWKLHDMLEEVEGNFFQDIVSWEPDGMAFKVHDFRMFVEKVMPMYFNQSRYESFRRQLRKYGFSRLDQDRYRSAYHHTFFQRANRQLCHNIIRENRSNEQSHTSDGDPERPNKKVAKAPRGEYH